MATAASAVRSGRGVRVARVPDGIGMFINGGSSHASGAWHVHVPDRSGCSCSRAACGFVDMDGTSSPCALHGGKSAEYAQSHSAEECFRIRLAGESYL